MPAPQSARTASRPVRLIAMVMIALLSFSGVLDVPTAQAALRTFAPRFATTARGDIKLIGNTLLTCPTSATCTAALAQTPPPSAAASNINNNDFAMANLDIDGVAGTVNSSSADLALGTCNNVLFAALYWSAISTSATRNQIQFGFGSPTPTYQLITASQVDFSPSTYPNSYQSFADVTTQVRATGSGTYWGANVQATLGSNTWAGWSLEVVCGDPTASLKRLMIYDGLQVVPPTPLTITLGNFFTPPVGSFTGAVGMVTYDGDRGSNGDGATFSTDKVATATTLTDALHPATNFFNSSIADAGANITARNPNSPNTLGFDIARITTNINQSTVGNGASSFSFKFTSSNETYEPGVFTFAMVVYEPEIFPSKTVSDINGGSLLSGDILEYTIVVTNSGSDPATPVVLDDPIPANTSYLPGSLQIVSGPNTGAKTDAAGDDQAEFSAGAVHFRLGTGANATSGGLLDCTNASCPNANPNTTTVRFRVTVNGSTPAGTAITNDAGVTYAGQSAASAGSPSSHTTSGAANTTVPTSAPSIAKSFTPASIAAGSVSQLRLTITNPNASTALSGVAVTDSFPAGLTVANPPGLSNTCGGTISPGTTAGNTSLALTGGSIAANSTCTIQVNLTSTTLGTATNTTGAVSSSNGGSGNTASAALTVNAPGISLTKSDSGISTTPGGTVVYALGYANTGSGALTGVTINETVPANSTFNAASSSAGWSCANGSPAGTVCALTIGALAVAASGSANFAITVNSPVPAGTTQIANSATITANGGTSNSAADTTPLITAPALSLSKTDGGASVTPGNPLVYTLNYANTGNVGLNGVALSEVVPASSTFRSAGSTAGWSCADNSPAGTVCTLAIGALAGGASGSATFALTIASPVSAGTTQIANSATIGDGTTSATGSDTTPVNTSPGLSITKSDGGASITPGGTIAYTLSYQNTGNVGLTGVALNETVPANSTFSAAGSSAGWSCANGSPAGTNCTLAIGALAGGASGSATFAVAVVNPIAAGVSQIANSVTISDAGGNSATNSDTTPVNTTPSLSLTKSDGGTTTTPGGTVAYTLSYQNTGNVGLTGVALNETVPANSTFNAAASSAGWSCANGAPASSACALAIGALAGGASGIATFAVTVASPVPAGTAQIANNATITANGGTTASASDTTAVVATPALSLTKSDGGATAAPGGAVAYTLNYRNTGNIGLSGVAINETVPANSTFDAAGSSAGWSCANGSPAGTPCTFTIGNLAGDASGSATFAITVISPVPAGTTQIANSATLTNGSTSATGSDSTPVITAPALSLAKSDGGATTTPGGAVVYTLNYANTGNVGLAGVVLNETVPTNSTFRSAGSTAGWSCANGSLAGTSCTLTLGNLAAGASGSATFAVTVATPLPAGVTQIANSAAITDGTTSATGSDNTPVSTTPGLTISKSDGGTTTTPGGIVAYTLGYANTGNVGLTSVVLQETVSANSSFNAASSSAGWSCANGSPAGTSCTLPIGALAGSASGTATFALAVVSPLPAGVTQIANSVTIADASGHTATNSDSTPVLATPRLSLAKSDGGATVTPGNPIIYTLDYANTGNIELAGVVLHETVPANTAFRSAGSTAGWSCPDASPAGTTCTLTIGNLTGGASGVATFAVTANTPVPAETTQIANVATVTDGSTSASSSDTTPMNTTPGLSLAKSDGGAIALPGGLAVYTLSYQNTGNVGLTGVELNEIVPANTTFDASNSSGGWSCANGDPAGSPCTLVIGALAGGAGGTATFAVALANPVPAGTTQIVNSATIVDGTTSATGSDSTPISATPSLSLLKSDGGVTSAPGGSVVYTLDYQNTGNIGLAGVVLNETVPANSTFSAAGSSAGWSCANGSPAGTSCTLAVGTLAGGASGTATFAVAVVNAVPAGTTQIANSATITNGTASATSSDSTPVDTTPGLTITKSDGGATTTPGGTVAYTIGYANTGNVGLTSVVIHETVPADASFAAAGSSGGWSCPDGSPVGTTCSLAIGNLAAGGSGSASFAITVNPAVPAGVAQINNAVTIEDNSGDSASNSDTTPLATSPGLSLTKSDGGASAIPGGTAVYTLGYQNTGNVGLNGVVLNEIVPANSRFSAAGSTAGWSCANGAPAGTACALTVGALAAGASGTAAFVVVVDTPFPAGITQIANTATLLDGTVSAVGSDTTPINTTPGLSIAKSDGGVTSVPGGTVIYTIDYQNTGDVSLAGVVLNEIVPANSTFVAGSSTAGWSCVDGAVAGTACALAIGDLPGGASGSAAFAVKVDDPIPAGTAQIANSVTITDGTTSATSGDSTPITTAPRLSLAKSDGGTATTPGGTVAYTLDYANTGNVGLTGVVLTETVPPNSTFAAGSSSAGWSCPDGSPVGTACTLTLGALAGGASGTATFAVTLANPVPAGTTQIANSATITDGTTSATSSDSTPVNTIPGLILTKSDGGATSVPGGTVVYTIGYANTGNVGLTGVVINETVPANSTFTAGSSSAGWSCADGDPSGTTCAFSIGGLAAGASGSANFAIMVATPLPAGVTEINNAVTITAGNGTSASNSDTTPVTTAPAITMAKSDGDATTTPGGTVAYSLSYQNTGNVDLAGVVLNEVVPANTTFRAAASSAGWSCPDSSPAGTICKLTIGAVAGGTGGGSTFAVAVDTPVPAGTTQLANSATITDGTTSATGSDSTPVATSASLSLAKSDGGAIGVPGGTVIYSLSYQNTGNVDLTGVVLSEIVPNSTTFSSAGSSAGWSCANGSPAGTTCVLPIGALAGGATGTATFAIAIDTPVPAGTSQIVNTAAIADDVISTTSSDTTPIATAPSLSLTKSDGGASAVPGAAVAYTLNYTNTGNVGRAGVRIDETVPANSTFDAANSSAGWSCASGDPAGTSCTLPIGALAGGASGSATFAIAVDAPLPNGVTQIANAAMITNGATSALGSDNTPITTTPSLSLAKSDGGASVIPGGTVVYTLNYANTGNVGLAGVRIDETVPANSTFDAANSSAGWSCADDSPAGTACTLTLGALAGGASGTTIFAVTVDTPVPAGTTQLANSATITDGTTSATSGDSTPITTVPRLSLIKSDGGTAAIPGGTIVYTLDYANTGNVGLTGVVINESMPANSSFDAANSSAGWSCADGSPAGTPCTLALGTLAGGASGTATFAITVDAPLPAGVVQIANSATISDGSTSATGGDSTPINTTPGLTITKSDGGATSVPGGTVVYTLGYANTGNVGLTGVTLNETVPANSTFSSAGSTAGWSCADGSPAGTSCTLPIGALAGGASGTATFAILVDAPLPAGVSQIENSVTIADTSGHSATNSDITPIATSPGLSVAKSDGGTTATPGSPVVYTLAYTNTGNVELTGVVLHEIVPANSTFRSAGSSAGWSCADGSPAGSACSITVGNLAGGSGASVTFAVTVDAPVPSGTIQIANAATITDGSTSATSSDSTPVNTIPGLTLTKSDGGAAATPGGAIIYTLNYANTGNVGLASVVLNESVPANSAFNALNSSAGWNCANGSPAGTACTLTLGTLAGGASGSATFAVTVNTPVPSGTTQIANSATITDGTTSAASSDSTPITTVPRLSLIKSDGGTAATPGGTIAYTLDYANTGNVGLTGVVLNESVPANSTFNAAASTAGWSCANGSPAGTPCTLTLGTLAGGASSSATFAVTVDTPVPAGTTQIANSATITDGTTSATSSDSTPVNTIPGLILTKSDGGATSVPGGIVVYTIGYANTGNVGLTGVVINETVPANSTFNAGGSAAGWSCANGSPAGVTCSLAIGALGAGATGSANFAVTLNAAVPAGTTQITNTVTLLDDSGHSATNSDITPVTTAPRLALSKTDGGATAAPGGTIIYSLNYQNTGNVGLTGVVINEIVPFNTSFSTAGSTAGWSCADGDPSGTSCSLTIGSLGAGASGTATFVVVVGTPFPAGVAQITNRATITDGTVSAASTDTTLVSATPGMNLAKDDGGTATTPGGTVRYSLTYANTGNVDLVGVTINEVVPATTSFNTAASSPGWSCANGDPSGTNCSLSVGTLAGGASGSVTFAVTVADPVPAGMAQIANSATITDGSTSAASGDSTPLNTTPGLTIAKSDGGVAAIPGALVAYALSYANSGNIGLTGVVLNETVPANSTFQSAGSSAGWSCADGSPAGTACTLTIGALAGGASGSATFAVTVASAVPAGTTQIANSATITDGSTSAASSDTTPVNTTPGLTITKSDGGATTTPGATVIYSLGYANTGNIGLTGVVLSEIVPANTSFTAGSSSAGWSCADGSPAGTACTLTISNLAAGASGSAAFAATVDTPLPAGTTQISNTVTIADANAHSASNSDTTLVVTTPGLTIAKSDGGITTAPGGGVVYTLSYANIGDVGLGSVSINEVVPAHTSFRAAGSTAGWSCADGAPAGTNCSLAIGALPGGANGSATFAVAVVAPVPANTSQIANSATISDATIAVAGSANDTTPVNSTHSVSLTKRAGATAAAPGDSIVYSLNYTNTGNIDLAGVVIGEIVPSNTTFQAAGSSPGWSCPDGSPAGTSCRFAISTLAGGTGGTTAFAVRVNNPIGVGGTQINNVATIAASDGTSAAASAGISVTAAPLLGAQKTVADLDAGSTLPGDVVQYAIAVQNTGNIAATGVTFTDAIPANTTYVIGSTALNGAPVADVAGAMPYAAGAPINTPGALSGQVNAGETAVIIFRVAINNPFPATVSQVNNQGLISANSLASIVTDDPSTGLSGDSTALTISNPTAITLVSFTARSQVNAIAVDWVTSAELKTWGFHLYRSADGTRAQAIRITPALILALGRGQGAAYSWIDRSVVAGRTYTYWLQEIELNGSTNEYGPASASYGSASAEHRTFIPFVSR